MAFEKMDKAKYPPRLWALISYPGDGKSTFAARMRSPILPIDADHRFAEVASLVEGDIYRLSNVPVDNINPERIHALLSENMPGSDIKTIVVDSLTAIISPVVTQAMIDNDAGRNKNRIAAFKDKALQMRLLQDAVTRWGTDTLWIYHLNDARDAKANEVTRSTLSETEEDRLRRSLNLQLHIVRDGDKRGIKVTWARRGRYGMTLWDEAGDWAGMPEKIESAVYDARPAPEFNGCETLDEFLFQLHLDFGLKEPKAKAILKEAGYESFPKAGNGTARQKSIEMYRAVKKSVESE